MKIGRLCSIQNMNFPLRLLSDREKSEKVDENVAKTLKPGEEL